ncbi:MAG TPA: hypothetical protein VG297_10890 [Bryobacteraceae bacterium]|nr:hypothetical protein [Bryobacteraceae bacterium]
MKKSSIDSRMRWLVLVMCVAAATSPGKAQTISTIAGNGNAAFSGDGFGATGASLNHPRGIALDGAGNLYIADSDNWRVRRVSATGTITTVAGNGTNAESGDGGSALSAAFSDVQSVVLDNSGNLYVADASNRRVRRITPAGIVTSAAGIGVEAFSGDGAAATSAGLGRPVGLAFDGLGNLYIADSTNQRIRKIDTNGIISTIAGNGVDAFSGDGGLATSASLGFPIAVAVDAANNVYVADGDNNRIRRITPGGIISTVAGNGQGGFSGDGGLATSASLNVPSGIAFDAAGNMYIADAGNNRVRKVDSTGTITTVAGGATNGFSGDNGPAAQALLDFPWALTTNGNNVYIADRVNNRIRLISYPATPPTVSANGVVNAASFANGVSIAPGAIVAIFGSNLSNASAQATLTPLPKTLGQTSVTFNAEPAPLFYASSGQVNAQVPFDIAPGTAVVQVTRGGSVSTSQPVSVGNVSPGIFIVDQPNNIGAIIHSNGTVVSAAAPARSGEFLSIYCTGLGPLTSPVASGSPGPSTPPLPQTTTTPVVKLGNASLTPSFSGLAPTFVGLYQVNFQMPAFVGAANQTIQLSIGGVLSNTATLAVSQ